ncbi:MAG: glycoside hydrolase family 6 protein [Gemmatimonadaceae bacterium]
MMNTLPARVYSHATKLVVPSTGAFRAVVAMPVLVSGLLAAKPAPARAQTVSQAVVNLFSGARLYVDPASEAKRQADAWRRTRPADAALMDKIAAQPLAQWVGEWNVDIGRDVANAVSRITGAKALPVFVAYNIPGRDCGQYSAGGANGSDAYKRWIRAFANGLGNRKAVVILEPDALAGMGCLSPRLQQERVDLIHDAVRVLRAKGAAVYIDAGHARWIDAAEMANRLRRAGVAEANGFSLNISNFLGTAVNVAYGTEVSKRVGGKHFIIDTSRNGQNATSAGNWCNPKGVRVGPAPTTRTGNPLVDAYLWVKTPGESDGTCGGGPAAGEWWGEYALGLAGGAWDRLLGRR